MSVGAATARTALTPMVWGTTYIVATEFLPEGRPMLAACVRALPVGVAFVLWSRRFPVGAWWWRSLVLGVLNIGAFFALLFVAAAIAGTVSMAVGVVLTKHWGRPVDLVTFTGWQLTAGGLMLLPLVVLTEGLPLSLLQLGGAGLVVSAVIAPQVRRQVRRTARAAPGIVSAS